MIDKDIEILKKLKTDMDIETGNKTYRLGSEEQQAIENVLKELENYKSQKIYHCYQYEVYELLKELETYKKIAEKLAEDKIIPKCKNCSDEDTHECTECALEWARNEVANDKQS